MKNGERFFVEKLNVIPGRSFQFQRAFLDNCTIIAFGYSVGFFGKNGDYIGDCSLIGDNVSKRIVIPIWNDNFVAETALPFYENGRKREFYPVNIPVSKKNKVKFSIEIFDPAEVSYQIKIYIKVRYRNERENCN